MEKNKLSNMFLMIFILLPFFIPSGLKMILPSISKILVPWGFISFYLTLIFYLKNKKMSFNIALIILFCLFLILPTILSPAGDLNNCISTILSILTPCLLIDYGMSKNSLLTLRSLNLLFELMVYLNFFTILIYPHGMYVSSTTGYYENWLLGYDNLHIFTIILAITFSVLYSYRKDDKINLRSKLCILVCMLSIFIRWSGTAVTAASVILIYLIFSKLINRFSIFNIKNYFIAYIIAFIGIVILKIQNKFSYFIVNILNKDITFTGRTFIWNYIIDYIRTKPLLGYGMELPNYRYNKSYIWRSYHAHNEFLEIFYTGGIALFLTFIVILFTILKRLYANRNYKEVKFLSWILLSVFIITLTEVYTISLLFLLIIVSMNVEYILKRGDSV